MENLTRDSPRICQSQLMLQQFNATNAKRAAEKIADEDDKKNERTKTRNDRQIDELRPTEYVQQATSQRLVRSANTIELIYFHNNEHERVQIVK